MQVTPQISYRNVEKTDDVENFINEKIVKLEEVCNYITSCNVAIEQKHQHQKTGKPYRVRIDVRVPPGHELVVTRISTKGEREEPLITVLERAFKAMWRQLKKLVERQRGEVKQHAQEHVMALVERLFPEKGYGFLRTLDGREIYFHSNSVLHGDFELLEIGTGVRLVEEMGEKGLQASTVDIVDKPRSHISREDSMV